MALSYATVVQKTVPSQSEVSIVRSKERRGRVAPPLIWRSSRTVRGSFQVVYLPTVVDLAAEQSGSSVASKIRRSIIVTFPSRLVGYDWLYTTPTRGTNQGQCTRRSIRLPIGGEI